MRYRRSDVVARAVEVLDAYGLADLSMRRIASELGLQPSALYHHFASKQQLLAAVADEVLQRGRRAGDEHLDWDAAVVATSHELRDAMLAYRDGAELVATVHAFGLGERRPATALRAAVDGAGLDDELAGVAASTVLHFVLGHVAAEQARLQASSVGAIDAPPLGGGSTDRSFELGLSLVVDGIRRRVSPGSASTATAR